MFFHPTLKRLLTQAARLLAVLLALLAAAPATGNQGFTEPYRTIYVASPEGGIVAQTLVDEGMVVEKGQPLAQLDVDLQQAQLEIARAAKDFRGHLDASRAEVRLRQQTLAALKRLRGDGHARQEEVDRAEADLAIARGQLTAAEEQQRLKTLEYERIRVQIARRTVVAPSAGVVTEVLKQEGEFTAPNDPNLVILVQLDPLYATFDLAREEAARLEVDQAAEVQLQETGDRCQGVVEHIAPVIDAESGTVAVKIRLPNSDGQLQSGQPCSLIVP